jgi:hypothetical protein
VQARPGPEEEDEEEEDANNAKRSAPRSLCAMLIKRIYEVFPLLCLLCSGEMRLIAMTNGGAGIRKILMHLGESLDSDAKCRTTKQCQLKTDKFELSSPRSVGTGIKHFRQS